VAVGTNCICRNNSGASVTEGSLFVGVLDATRVVWQELERQHQRAFVVGTIRYQMLVSLLALK